MEGAGDVHEVGRLATIVERARGDLDVVGEVVVGVIERGDTIRRLQKLEESGSTTNIQLVVNSQFRLLFLVMRPSY